MRQIPIFVLIMLDAMSTGMMLPVLAPLVISNHGILSYYSAETKHMLYGLVLTIFNFSFMLGAPLWGYLSDKWGRKKILIICLLGTTVSFIFYIISFIRLSIAILFFGRFLGGLTSGSQSVAQAVIAESSVGAQKAANIGMIAVGMTIGLVIGPLIGGILSDSHFVGFFNNTTPFYASFILSFCNFLFLLFCYKEHVVDCHLCEPFRHFHPSVDPAETGIYYFKWISVFAGKTRLLIILITFFLFELSWSLYFQSLALLLVQRFHFSNSLVGVFSSFVGLMLSLVLVYLVRFFIKRESLPRIIKKGLWLGAASLIVIFFIHSVLAQCLLAILISASVGLCYACMIALASDQVSTNKQGLLMGITDAVLALAFSITGLLSGFFAYFSVGLPQLVAGIFMLLGVIFYDVMSRCG